MPGSLRIAAIGGGTGLSTLLRGLREFVDAPPPWSISKLSAIVTVTDEGGSSGELRRELSMLPPGDIRNCIVALAEEEQLLSRVFNYRFENDSRLKGHSLGNLLIAALTEITGSFDAAIMAASEVLAIRGEIFPSTLRDVRLRATCVDGTELTGELEISGERFQQPARPPQHARIAQLRLDPPDAEPLERALEALRAADLILIGPGSLYTSILPNLVINRIAETLRTVSSLRVYVCNVMTQPGETEGYSAEDHLRAIIDHAGAVVDVMVLNDRRASAALLKTYEAEGQYPVAFDVNQIRALDVTPFFGDIISEGNHVRHDPVALVRAIFQLYDQYGAGRARIGSGRE